MNFLSTPSRVSLLTAIGLFCSFGISLPAADQEAITLPPHTFLLPKGYALKPVAALELLDATEPWLDELEVAAATPIETVTTKAPPKRAGGIMVETVDELVAKLKEKSLI